MINPEQVFQLKQQLEQQSHELEKTLLEIQQKQQETKSVEHLAELILQYEEVQRQITDRGQLFIFFSNPESTITSPYKKAELFTTIEAAETIGLQLVDVVADMILEQVRQDIQSGEDDSADLVIAEYKEYILPAKIIAGRFDQIDMLIDEMMRACKSIDPQMNDEQAHAALVYAFEAALDADIVVDPVIQALRETEFRSLKPEDRAMLLDRVEERLAVLRYEKTKQQNIAMDQALAMIEKREAKLH
jgi:hypothetical protein